MAITAPPCRGHVLGAAQVEPQALRARTRHGPGDDRGVHELGHGEEPPDRPGHRGVSAPPRGRRAARFTASADLAGAVDRDVGVLRRLVALPDAGHVRQGAGLRLGVETLRVALDHDVGRGVDPHLDEVALGEQALARARRSPRNGDTSDTMTISPASTISLAVSATRRTFSARSSGVNPRSLFRPVRTPSPSRTYVCRPMPCSLRSSASAMVDLPAPGRPVSHSTRGRWFLSVARASRSTVKVCGTTLCARRSAWRTRPGGDGVPADPLDEQEAAGVPAERRTGRAAPGCRWRSRPGRCRSSSSVRAAISSPETTSRRLRIAVTTAGHRRASRRAAGRTGRAAARPPRSRPGRRRRRSPVAGTASSARPSAGATIRSPRVTSVSVVEGRGRRPGRRRPARRPRRRRGPGRPWSATPLAVDRPPCRPGRTEPGDDGAGVAAEVVGAHDVLHRAAGTGVAVVVVDRAGSQDVSDSSTVGPWYQGISRRPVDHVVAGQRADRDRPTTSSRSKRAAPRARRRRTPRRRRGRSRRRPSC